MSDLISRQTAIEELREAYWNKVIQSAIVDAVTDWAIRKIKGLPTIDAVPVKHGAWVDVMNEEWCTFDECKCSECGVVEYFNKGWKKYNYCPNCGAKMDGERKDDAVN